MSTFISRHNICDVDKSTFKLFYEFSFLKYFASVNTGLHCLLLFKTKIKKNYLFNFFIVISFQRMTGTNDIMGELDTYNLLNNDHNESVYSIPMSKIDTQSNSLIDLTKPIGIKKRSIDFTNNNDNNNNNNNNNQSNTEINSEDKINEPTNAKKQKITKVSLLSEDGPTSLKPDENKSVIINKNDSKNQKINTSDIEQIKNTSYFIDKYKNITASLNTKNSNAFFHKTMINFNFSDLLSSSNYLSDYKIVIADSNPMKKSIVLNCHKLILAFSSGFFNAKFYADHITEKSCYRSNTISQIIHRNTDTITIYASEFYNCSVDDLAFMIRFLYNPNIHELSKICSSFFDIIKIYELGTYFDIQQYKILAQVRIYKILDIKNVFLFFSNLIQSKKYEQHKVLITHCECFMAVNNGEEYIKKILDTVRNTDNKEIQERLSKSMLNITNYEKEHKTDQAKKCLEFFGLKYFISYELYLYIKSNIPSLLNNK
jgi:hypothetical protein